jgi:DnaJ like chaperone protein
MTSTEIIVIVVGAGLGYLAVSALMGGKPPRKWGTPPGGMPPGEAPGWPPPPAPAPAPADPAWHEVLGVAPDAGDEDVQRAYRSLMSQYHPDKVASLGVELQALAERKTKDLVAAYQVWQALRGDGRR